MLVDLTEMPERSVLLHRPWWLLDTVTSIGRDACDEVETRSPPISAVCYDGKCSLASFLAESNADSSWSRLWRLLTPAGNLLCHGWNSQ